MRLNLLPYLMMVFALTSCRQIPDPMRNNIVLTDEIHQVADSIAHLESLLKKLPEDPMMGSFLDDEGNLYVNTEKVGLLKNALSDSTIRGNPVFKNFSDSDFKQFISITVFLLRNHIDASRKNNVSGLFTHEYRRTDENVYNDIRDIMVDVDTTSKPFTKHYQILDRKDNMVLVAPIEVKVR